MPTYAIAPAADPARTHEAIWAHLLAFNQAAVGDAEGVPFALEITADDDPAVRGGLWAASLWGSFYIGLIVTPAEARGHGLGRELMRRAEQEARARGCRQMWLDTFAFQARPFYEQLGFTLFGQIDGPPPIFPRYFMQKLIA